MLLDIVAVIQRKEEKAVGRSAKSRKNTLSLHILHAVLEGAGWLLGKTVLLLIQGH